MVSKETLKACRQGHQLYKSSNCPTCPVCEEAHKPKDSFLAVLGAPARRALEGKKILTVEVLAKWTEKDLLLLHGIGPSSIPKLKKVLKDSGLSFKT